MGARDSYSSSTVSAIEQVDAIDKVDVIDQFLEKFLVVWGQAVPLVILVISTVVFNTLVLWMFKMKRSLRSCKNIYLASLALADLIIGLCMFLAIFQQLKGHAEWLPLQWCKLYLIIRQSALYVSLLSLVLITGDRWWSIHYPFSYRTRRRKRYAFVAVACVWVFGFAIHVPATTLWSDNQHFDDTSNLTYSKYNILIHSADHSCDLPFTQSTLFVSIVSVVQYFLPLMAMLSLNCSLYVGILQRKNVQIRRSVSTSDKHSWQDKRTSVTSTLVSIPDFNFLAEETIHLLNGGGPRRCHLRLNPIRRSSADVVLLRSNTSAAYFGTTDDPSHPRNRRFSWVPRRNSIRPIKCGEELAKTLLLKQDRRAAFWLGLLVLVFLVCWLPHTVVAILQSTKHVAVPQWIKDLTLWFLLVNSAVNPLMYGFFNREIRRAFKQWLCGNAGRRLRIKNALALYGVSLTAALAVHKPASPFETVPE